MSISRLAKKGSPNEVPLPEYSAVLSPQSRIDLDNGLKLLSGSLKRLPKDQGRRVRRRYGWSLVAESLIML